MSWEYVIARFAVTNATQSAVDSTAMVVEGT